MISLDISWDLSATIQQIDVNNNQFETKLPGRFDPTTVEPDDIHALCFKLIDGFTTNQSYNVWLTARRDLYKSEGDENG